MATTKNVPSDNFEDLLQDVRAVTLYMNGDEPFNTRTGRKITPIPAQQNIVQNILLNSGFQPVGAFTSGGVITALNQVMFNSADNSYYNWQGALPLIVPAGTDPRANSSPAAWINRGSIFSQIHAVRCLKNLTGITPIHGQQFSVAGFYEGSICGGGLFLYDANRSKSSHNGVTVIAPEALNVWPGSQDSLSLLHSWSGAGHGVFVRQFNLPTSQPEVTPEMAGAIGGHSLDGVALEAAHKTKLSVRYGAGSYTIDVCNKIYLYDGCQYIGSKTEIITTGNINLHDVVGDFGRWDNHLFYRPENTPLKYGIRVSGFIFRPSDAKINMIGAASAIESVHQQQGWFDLSDISVYHVGTPSGLGANSNLHAQTGAIFYGNGYKLRARLVDGHDVGQGIIAMNSKVVDLESVRTFYCGTSRDHTSWCNSGSLLLRSSEEIKISSCYSYVTGGSSYFLSMDSTLNCKSLEIVDCTLIGCGLSALSCGTRTYTPIDMVCDYIIIRGLVVKGFDCAINGNLHTGVKIDFDNTRAGNVLKSVTVDAEIDYLAPWERFDSNSGDVIGSFNQNKTKGFDVGSQFGLSVGGSSNARVGDVNIKATVKNHQRGAVGISRCQDVNIELTLHNNGWSKKADNSPWQTAQSLNLQSNVKVSGSVEITNHAVGVSNERSWCTPVRFTSEPNVTLSLSVINSGNQDRTVRINTPPPGFEYNFSHFESSAFGLDAGHRRYIDSTADLSVGQLLGDHGSVDITTGARTLDWLTRRVKKSSSDISNRIQTLRKSSSLIGAVVELWGGFGVDTLNAHPDDTIDGLPSIILGENYKAKLFATSNGWITLAYDSGAIVIPQLLNEQPNWQVGSNVIADGRVVSFSSAGNFAFANVSIAFSAGRTYLIEFNIESISQGEIIVRLSGGASIVESDAFSTTGRKGVFLTSNSNIVFSLLCRNGPTTAVVKDIYIRQIGA